MSLLSGFNISFDELRLMGEASRAAFVGGAIPAGWNVVTPAQLGLAPQYRNGNYFTDPASGASAIVLQQGSQFIVSFRGTDGADDINQFPSLASGAYINNFQPLLSALVNATSAGTQFYFTGASLGGGATNLMANIAQSQYGGHFASAKFVAFASPNISNANGILNVGFENDPVYKAINGYGDFASSLDNLVYATLEYMAGNYDGQHPQSTYAHGSFGALDALNRIAQSIFSAAMGPDSVVILDAANQLVQDITPGRENTGVFYIGETIDDQIAGRNGGDHLEGFGGNDSLNGGAGNDFLAGGVGLDTLRGASGADAFFLEASALAQAQAGIFDRIVDYNQGNSGSFSASEGDTVDLSALLAAIYNHGNGPPAGSLVQVLEDASNGFALLRINPTGSSGNQGWVTVARLDGIHVNQDVIVVLDPAQPGGIAIRSSFNPSSAAGGPANDFNADGNSDILWQRTDGRLQIFDMDGARILSVSNVGQMGGEWKVVGTADYHGDLTSDILWQRNDGSLMLFEMANNQVQRATAVGQVGNEWQVTGSADFNGDGRGDILWQRDNGTLMIFDMNGPQITAAPIVGQIGPEWRLQGTGDYNGDGTGDLLWRRADGSLLMFEMANNQVQKATIVGQVGNEWQIAGSGDFNGDHKTDVLWHRNDGTLLIYNMDGARIASVAFPGQLGKEWSLEGTGDYDGDDTADLLWHRSDGTLLLFEMANNQVQQATVFGQVGPEWDII